MPHSHAPPPPQGPSTRSEQVLDPQLQVKITPILSMIRDKCLRLGEKGLEELRRRINARNGTQMDPDNFQATLAEMGVLLSSGDLKTLTLAFKDGRGYLRADKVCNDICGFADPAKEAVIQELFGTLDVAGRGFLDVPELRAAADFSSHPMVRRGQLTPDEALRLFLPLLDTSEPRITQEEFSAFYAGWDDTHTTLTVDEFRRAVADPWSYVDLSRSGPKPSTERMPDTHQPSELLPARVASGTANYNTTLTTAKPESTPLTAGKRIVGYTGHVPLARDRFGETFYRIDAATPELVVTKEQYYGKPYVDESKGFVRKGNKSNAHSFKWA